MRERVDIVDNIISYTRHMRRFIAERKMPRAVARAARCH